MVVPMRSVMSRINAGMSTARGCSGWRRAKASRRWTSVFARSADCSALDQLSSWASCVRGA